MLSRRIGFDEVIESGFVSRRGIGGSGLDRGRNTRLQHRSCYVEPTTNQSFRRICACRVKCGIFVRLYFSLLIPKHLLLKDLIMMLKFCECTTTVQISVGAGWLVGFQDRLVDQEEITKVTRISSSGKHFQDY
jgi:hypothetical protein